MSEYFERVSLQVQKGFHRVASIKPLQPIPGGMRFLCESGQLDIHYFAPGVIRFSFKTGDGVDYGLLTTEPQEIACHIEPFDRGIALNAGGISLEVTLSPFSFKLKRSGNLILESITDCSMEGPTRFHAFAHSAKPAWQISLALKSGEPVYGLGEKFGRLDHRGEMITSWNSDALGVNAERSYKNTPFAWSPEGWGFFVNTPSRVTHAVGHSHWSHRSYIAQVEDTNLDFFLFAADTPAEIINAYTVLTGKTPLLPVWSYGLWMARAYYRTADELLDVVKEMRARQIPLDVILLDGRAWHKPETRFDFSWDPERYPDPVGFIRQLDAYHVRLCLWEYPYISTFNPLFNELANRGYLLKTLDGQTYIHQWLPEPYELMLPQLCPSGIIDFTNPNAYAWFRDQHKVLFEMGVAVMKTDFGEAVPEQVVAYNGDSGTRLHNVYALLYNRCVYEATQLYAQGQPMVWGRSGWTGSQRYPMGWGGDPQSDWEGLAASIRGGQSWGMSGGPFYAHDIGGWYGALKDLELFVRWTQAGVMCSHTRFHGGGPREPWIFGPEVESIICQWIKWRYRLIPYLRACEREASQTGMPVMRSMALAFPKERAAWSFEEQYMLGPSLLVSPIIQSGGHGEVYLPKGGWYDFSTGQRYEGGQVISLENVPLDQMPVYGREGSCLPLGPAVQHTGELATGDVIDELWIFGDPDPAITLDIDQAKLEEINGNWQFTLPEGVTQKRYR